jgi:hypothetical protein
MKRSFVLIAFILTFGLFACKKDTISSKEQYSKLIVGTWTSHQQNTKIYDVSSNELLKDSTINFDGETGGRPWSEIFSTDGNAYVTSTSRKLGATVATTDTTTYSNYSILGTNLTLKQFIGGSQTKPILTLTSTELVLQYSYVGTLNAGWGLNTESTYKIVQATYYIKQY